MLVLSELAVFLDSLCSSAKSIKDLFDTSTLLHRDDSELILFVDPDEERLSIVVEDTSTRRPISVEVASLEEPISFPKKMMSDILNFEIQIYGHLNFM